MAPKQPETLEERMYASELAQEQMERFRSDCETELIAVRGLAMEAIGESQKTARLVEAMPAKVVQMIDERSRGRKLDVKDWILFWFAAVSMIGTVSGIVSNAMKAVGP